MPLLHALLRPGSSMPGCGGAGRAHSPMPVRLDIRTSLAPVTSSSSRTRTATRVGESRSARCCTGGLATSRRTPRRSRDRHGTVYVQRCDGAYSRQGGAVAAWCSWLIAYLPYAVTRPWISEMHEQVEKLLATIRAKIGTQPGRTRKDAPCPTCACFALVETDGEWHIHCESCGEHLTPADYTEHRAAVLPGLAAIALQIAVRQAQGGGARSGMTEPRASGRGLSRTRLLGGRVQVGALPGPLHALTEAHRHRIGGSSPQARSPVLRPTHLPLSLVDNSGSGRRLGPHLRAAAPPLDGSGDSLRQVASMTCDQTAPPKDVPVWSSDLTLRTNTPRRRRHRQRPRTGEVDPQLEASDTLASWKQWHGAPSAHSQRQA